MGLSPWMLFVHVVAAAIWIGGMTFAHFCLRPAALEVLEPPQRLALWRSVLRRFFRIVTATVLALLASGFVLYVRLGPATAPLGWHLMAAIGIGMSLVYGYIALALFPAFSASVGAEDWASGARVLARIRTLVTVNLALGIVTVLCATVGASASG
jgi:uncharacterized membrane protein